MKLYCKANK